MEGITLEQVIRHTLRFIAKFGMPKMYQDHIASVTIHEFRGLLPCDLVSIDQVKNCNTQLCMRSMTDSFNPGLLPPSSRPIPPQHFGEDTWKSDGRVIFTSFAEGKVEIAYKAIRVDEDGFPMVMDNEVYLDALENYIQKRVLKNKFRKGDISAAVYDDVKQDYAWSAAQLQSELTIPSYSEMQSIQNAVTALIPRMTEFYTAFRHTGNTELQKSHDNRR